MRVKLMKGKIHRATVTGARPDYEGSISISPRLLERSGIREFERVLVANASNGSRFETYTMSGRDGEISLNGAAALLGDVGDKVIVMAWADLDESECAGFRPRVVLVDEDNLPRG